MSEKLWFLKNCDLFERLDADELARIESRSRSREFPRKSPIYLPADLADGVLLMVRGRAKICSLTADGKQSILAFIEPGELFGELAMVAAGAREEYAEAIEKSTVVLIPNEEMNRLVAANPEVSLGITKLMGLRRQRIEPRLKYLLYHSNRERLVNLLLELSEQYGQPTNAGIELGIRLSHQDLASVIGATRETVTVTLGELQKEGLLSVGRKSIILLDANHLAQSVGREVPKSIGNDAQEAARPRFPETTAQGARDGP
jgi:CRP/FNR family cyclic AMP-dependent transcriptional regulator